jgi:hypothetical protein
MEHLSISSSKQDDDSRDKDSGKEVHVGFIVVCGYGVVLFEFEEDVFR